MKVYRDDLDAMEPRWCASGVRRWAARMGLDWSAFLRDGIDIEVLEKLDDAMAAKMVEFVRANRGR